MRPRKCRPSPALLFLLVVAAWGVGFGADPAAAEVNVPNWQLRCADGQKVDFHAELARGPVLVSFWALWCKPCLKELPHLDALAAQYEGQLQILAVNIDSQRSVAKVRPYLKSKGYGLTVPLDTAGDLQRQMQVGGAVPFLVLYDSDGQEVYRHTGYKEGDEIALQKKIQTLMGPAAGGAE